MAEQRNDGGSAFPMLGNVAHNSDWAIDHGMSLRDWYAGKALPAIIAATSAGQHQPQMRQGESRIAHAIARDAFEMADAMIAARDGGGNG